MKTSATPKVVTSEPHENATDLLLTRVRQHPQHAAYAIQRDGAWHDVSPQEFLDDVRSVAKGLIASGLTPGGVVAIMSKTRYEWSLVDFAIWFAGGASTPVYETSSPHQVSWIVADSEASFAFAESARHREILQGTDGIDAVWEFDRGDLEELRAAGEEISDEALEEARSHAGLDDVATIIYTSGTTGRPKGVVLTHGNFVELSRNATATLGATVAPPGSRTLMFLPLAHVFARFVETLTITAGATMGHTPDTSNLLGDLASFKPTFLLAVPRVFEKVFNGAEAKAQAAGNGKIFSAAARTAVAWSEAYGKGKVPLPLRARRAVFDKLVYRKLRDAMGGEVAYAISGGAPLGARLGHFFRGIGVQILEGYGLTETTAPACVTVPGKVRIGTVGPPLAGGEIAISDDGEILCRGIMVFREYRNNPEATAAAFQDGWFRTGDLGDLDEAGNLTITGRQKEIIVTASGKNVAPAVLEDRLRAHPLVSQCMVVGDQKPFIGAVLTLDSEMLPTWLQNNDLPALDVAAAAHDEGVRAALQEAIDDANTAVSRAESIREFTVLERDFTEADGYLTPSLKLKRNEVAKDFADEIAALYAMC